MVCMMNWIRQEEGQDIWLNVNKHLNSKMMRWSIIWFCFTAKSSDDAWNYYKSEIDDSKLIDLFVGQFASVITCTFCENTSTCWDPFWDLSLPIPQTRFCKKCCFQFY